MITLLPSLLGGDPTAVLAFEDGTVYCGRSFGAPGERAGEAVFNTSMTGYQEILTDPSYSGQIVTLTYPLIGNYGVNVDDSESSRVQVEGFVVREASRIVSGVRHRGSLQDFLKEHDVVGMEGVDTRSLTMHIRSAGAMTAVLSTKDLNPESLVEKARKAPSLVGRDLVRAVSCTEKFEWTEATPEESAWTEEGKYVQGVGEEAGKGAHIVVYDFGVKWNILRMLKALGCKVTVVPAWTAAEEVMGFKPDGVLLSNGPGDPEPVSYAFKEIAVLLERGVPIFGICLGHQLLALALGAKTYKLKFGHRGGNHPVKNLQTGRVSITSQNHGFCVDPETLPAGKTEITHVNLNDGTLEGFRLKSGRACCVQYHPEASPGPHDARNLFTVFLRAAGKEVVR